MDKGGDGDAELGSIKSDIGLTLQVKASVHCAVLKARKAQLLSF